jgi:opacity protein-like surface antigen
MKRQLLHGLVLAAALSALSAAAWAQPVFAPREDLHFDRPEAWAMKYFTSVTLLTGLGVPRSLPAGAIEIGLEGGWVPGLSEEERRVGFYGTKVEDLNKTSIFGRPRLTVGLPASFSVTVAWAPPGKVGGVEPNLVSLALARPIWEGEVARLGLRLHAQDGSIQGDITCPEEAVAAGDDPIANPFNCQETSEDETTLRYAGLEGGAAFALGGGDRLEGHVAASVNRLDTEFQVDALYAGFRDRTLQLTEGTTWSLAAGLSYAPSDRTRLAVEAFWTPLDIVRTEGARTTREDLFNLRALLSFRAR